ADFKEARTGKRADQIAAGIGAVLIIDQGRHAIYVQTQRIPVEQQHHHRHSERHRQAARVSRDVVKLLDEDGSQPAVAHAALRSSASIMATNTSSMEGGICSIFFTAIAFAASALRMRAAVASGSSTSTCRPPPNTATSRTPSSPSIARIVSNASDESSCS